MALLVPAGGPQARAETLYWSGTTETGTTAPRWSTLLAWSVNPAGGASPAPAAIPGGGDSVVFSIAPLVTPQTVYLDGNQAALGLTFSSTAATTILGGAAGSPAANTLAVGTGGIRTTASAGPVTIGSGGADDVSVALGGSQTWTTLGGTRLTLAGPVQGSAATGQSQTLTFDGAGQTIVAGPITNGPGGGVLNLAKTGWGSLRLSASNSFTGTTTVTTGQLIVSSNGALGSGPAFVTSPGSTTRSPTGGQLVLDGVQSGVTLSSNLSLTGAGPGGNREGTVAAYGPGVLLNVGNNTLSGAITTGTDGTWTNLTSTYGTVAMTGTLNLVAGRTTLGTVNGAGAGGFNIAGTLAGSQTLLKIGPGTLFLNPVETGSFSGGISQRTESTIGQSSIRITQDKVLGSNTGFVISQGSGAIEVRMDNPRMQLSGTADGIDARISILDGPIVLDHAPGSTAVSGTLSLTEVNRVGTNGNNPENVSRNGYALRAETASFGNTFNNAFSGGLFVTGTLSGGRMAGSANSVVTGVLAGTSFTKSGVGLMSLTGTNTDATFSGAVAVSGGGLQITDFRSFNNQAGSSISLGTTASGGAAAALIIGSTVAPGGPAALTSLRSVNLSGGTGQNGWIYANQSGPDPVVFNSNLTVSTAGAKTLVLAGTNTLENAFNGAIVNGASPTSLLKQGSGVWVLGGTNT